MSLSRRHARKEYESGCTTLMDWHHPDGATRAIDEAARRRFIDYTHGLIRELMTNYGKIDILAYDGGMPFGRRRLGITTHEQNGVRTATRT